MANPLFDPPGIHQEAESLQSLIAKAKPYVEKIAQRKRMNLEDALPLGRILNRLHEKCGHGQWGPSIAQIGVSDDNARDYMSLANSGHLGIQNCKSIREALLTISTARSLSDSPQAKTAPAPEWKGCREHRYGIVPNTTCPRCQLLNQPAGPESSKNGPPSPDDTVIDVRTSPSQETASEAPKRHGNRQPAREPGSDDGPPNPWMKPILRIEKPLAKRIDEMSRELAAPALDIQALRERWTAFAEQWAKVAACKERAIKAPNKGQCRYCKASVLWAMTEKRKNVALEESCNGGWDVVDNEAHQSVGGPYRLHHRFCPKHPKRTTEQPVLE